MTTTFATPSPVYASAPQAGKQSVDSSALGPLVESQTSIPESVTEIAFKVERALAGRQWLGGGDVVRPIRVHIESAVEGFTVSEPETGIFGIGRDLPSALQDFRVALGEHRDVLESSEALSEDLRRQLRFLRRHPRAA